MIPKQNIEHRPNFFLNETLSFTSVGIGMARTTKSSTILMIAYDQISPELL